MSRVFCNALIHLLLWRTGLLMARQKTSLTPVHVSCTPQALQISDPDRTINMSYLSEHGPLEGPADCGIAEVPGRQLRRAQASEAQSIYAGAWCTLRRLLSIALRIPAACVPLQHSGRHWLRLGPFWEMQLKFSLLSTA